MNVLPGLFLALLLALAGQFLSVIIGETLLGLPTSPISAIMMAILLGILIRNTFGLHPVMLPGVRFGLVRVLRLGIVLLGIRLSLAEAASIGLQSLPIIVGCATAALFIVTYLSVKLGLSSKFGTLLAVGTSICGATAIVALAPAILARDEEVAYSVACITLFGIAAMLVYPFAAHWMFNGDASLSGLFLGTAVHETAQVAGAGMVYQQYYGDPKALDVATVAKLVRNLTMLLVIPVMSVLYHKRSAGDLVKLRWWTMIPLFVIGFACTSILRTIGDMNTPAFGFMEPEAWASFIAYAKSASEVCLAVAMAAVGLGTCIDDIRRTGMRPMIVGSLSAVLVGIISATLIKMFY